MKKIALMLTLCLIFSALFGVNAFAATDENGGIAPCFTNTAATNTTFDVNSDNTADVCVSYCGYPDMVSRATISIKIEKRNLFFFWKDICTDEIISYTEDFIDGRTYQLSGSGKYRLTVTYTIEGPSGVADVITSELEDSY